MDDVMDGSGALLWINLKSTSIQLNDDRLIVQRRIRTTSQAAKIKWLMQMRASSADYGTLGRPCTFPVIYRDRTALDSWVKNED
ncbi:hypothetical protein E1301_Tti006368 [Triplophysa tibetana]|uniref:Uncharacterized protein n=1 Tax=Triplophysa tibetana TaxID=1572043 RepID=A0A5A9NYC4_9TELE|nr:hypothetical protein E1301_Tti006368 [Triplophysa tibetana]